MAEGNRTVVISMTPAEINARLGEAHTRWRENGSGSFDRAFLASAGFADLVAIAANNKAYFDQIAWRHPAARHDWVDRYGRRQDYPVRGNSRLKNF